MTIDEFLVLNIDQGEEVGDAGGEESHAPHGEELDQVVGEECSSEGLEMLVALGNLGVSAYSSCSWDVLSEYYTLDLDDKEVGEVLDIVKSSFERLFWDLVVPAGADSACDTAAHNSLGCDFSEGDNCEMSDL